MAHEFNRVANKETDGSPSEVRCFRLLDSKGAGKISPAVGRTEQFALVTTKNGFQSKRALQNHSAS